MIRIKIYLYILLLSFLFEKVYSAEDNFQHNHELDTSRIWTSDGWQSDLFKMGLHHPKSNLEWAYPNEPEKGSTWSVDVQTGTKTLDSNYLKFDEIDTSLFLKLSNKKVFLGQVGILNLENQRKEQRLIPTGMLQFENLDNRYFFKMKLRQDNVSQYLMGNIEWMKRVDALELNPILKIFILSDLILKSDYQQLHMTDGNLRQKIDLDLKKGFAISEPWFWMGPGLEYASFRNEDSLYWSPQKVLSYGLRLDASKAIGNQFRINLGASYHQLQENDLTPGWGHYLITGISWGLRETQKVTIQYEDIQSKQNASTWYSHGVGLNVLWSY